jgi:1,2-diacylglycerol 3-alpha-glucosyltransferase
MRIGMMADSYKPYLSGVTNYISLNKSVLEQLGHEVFVFTFGEQDYPDQEKNVIRSLGLPIVTKGFNLGVIYTPQAKTLLRSMDIVHVHHPFISGRLAIRYCRPLSIPIVFTNHTRYDIYLQEYAPGIPQGWGNAFLQAFMPNFCRSVDLVIAPSAGMEKIMRQLGVESPITVIPNGIDREAFRSSAAPFQRGSFGFSDENVILVYTGRVAPEKNLPFLLRAFAGVAQTYDQARLIIMGDGPVKEELEQTSRDLGISQKVVFTGERPYTEVPAYMAMCDVFVTASVSEVHPLSVIEAMSVGLPVLGIDSPGVGDTIENGVNGLLSSEDIAAYAVKMAQLVSDSALRERLGQAALASSGKYAIDKTVQQVLNHYQRLVAGSKRKRRNLKTYLRSVWERFRQ